MARLARFTLENHAHCIVLKGNNSQAIFFSDEDRLRFIEILKNHSKEFDTDVHAYSLSNTEVILIATPKQHQSLSKVMQSTGRSYVRFFNNKYHRTGTLWEGRFRSTLIQSNQYLLPLLIYLDLRSITLVPERIKIDCIWSSHRFYLGLEALSWLKSPSEYWFLGNTPFERENTYSELIKKGLDPHVQKKIEQALSGGWILGTTDFTLKIQEQTNRRVIKNKPGRPKKKAD